MRAELALDKPIRYIVPFPPGGFNDTLARTIAAKLQKTLGQPVVVDNRPGGNTIIGTDAAAKSPPDGYTLFGAALPFSVNQSLYKTAVRRRRRTSRRSRWPASTPNLLVVHPVAAGELGEGADRLRARRSPGKLNYGSTGNGTSNHLSMELFKSDGRHRHARTSRTRAARRR